MICIVKYEPLTQSREAEKEAEQDTNRIFISICMQPKPLSPMVRGVFPSSYRRIRKSEV
jgi:hypothetical protein